MQKTQQEANWDMDNDSDIKGQSESSDEENGMLHDFYTNAEMWRATTKPKVAFDQLGGNTVAPFIQGIGGCWGLGVKD